MHYTHSRVAAGRVRLCHPRKPTKNGCTLGRSRPPEMAGTSQSGLVQTGFPFCRLSEEQKQESPKSQRLLSLPDHRIDLRGSLLYHHSSRPAPIRWSLFPLIFTGLISPCSLVLCVRPSGPAVLSSPGKSGSAHSIRPPYLRPPFDPPPMLSPTMDEKGKKDRRRWRDETWSRGQDD